VFINAGVYDIDGELELPENQGGQKINVKTIDSLQLDRLSFIKMDIEGAEINALKGAKMTILRDKPKLAICIYHSNDDMLQIPEFLFSLAPDYKFFIRQYDLNREIVLYALPQEDSHFVHSDIRK
jgi:hypothetical protein